MGKQTASARGAAKGAKPKAKEAEAEANRAATAQAKADDAKAKAVIITKTTQIGELLAQLKSLVDSACERFETDMHDAAELAFRLQDEFGLSQIKIGEAIGRSQQWVSAILIWRLKGYPETAFGPQAKQARARLLPVTGNDKADLNAGMPPGPKLALMPDNTIATLTGNDVGTQAPDETPKVVTSDDAGATLMPEPEQGSAQLTREETSDDLLTKAKKFWREEIAAGITDDDVRKFRDFLLDERQWKPRARSAA